MIPLENDEKILLEVRKHPFVIVSAAVGVAIALVLPFLLLFAVGAASSFLSADMVRNAAPLAMFLYSLWVLALWMFFFIEWTDYYLDAWYVTDRRVVDVEQRGIFNREVISFRHDSIQDITVETRGVLQTLLKFGDIHIQTAGASRKIVLRSARDAEKAKEYILALHHSSKMDARR